MTRLEVQHALAVEPNDTALDEEGIPDEDILISACAGLVTVDMESSVVRLVHYTAQEYFESTFQTRLMPFKTEIALTCITYLSFTTLDPRNNLDQQLQSHALLAYAAQHWGDHAREAPRDAIPLQDKILAFCGDQERVKTWYRVVYRLRHGYDMDTASLSKPTGLHVAAGLGLTETVRSLLSSTARTGTASMDALNAADAHGETPLHWAARGGHEAAAGALLAREEVRADAEDAQGLTPLALAAAGGHDGVVRLLASRPDVRVDRADPLLGETALWRAADRGHAAAVRALLDCAGAAHPGRVDVNVKDRFYGETPILRAAEQGHVEVVRELLTRPDVDVLAGDRFFKVGPLERAREKGHDEIVRLLEDYIAGVRRQDG